jgi:hypothetical protein
MLNGIASLVLAHSGLADTYTWNGAQNTDWFQPNNWTPTGSVPDGADVIYAGVGTNLILTNETPFLGTFTMSGGTLVCSNWFTRIQATNVVLEGGILTLPGTFTNGGTSNRIHVVCSSLNVATGATLNADGKGFAPANGPGTTASSGTLRGGSGGAGHGGIGGTAESGVAGGAAYGDPLQPVQPGSGAGPTTSAIGGAGGGVIRLEVAHHAILDGVISANGAKGGAGAADRFGGGGAGGSILLVCETLSGTGTVRALGADGITNATYHGGGGGGGRIALHFDAAQQALLPRPGLSFSVAPGLTAFPLYDRQYWLQADWGTLYFTDLSALVDLTVPIQNLAGYLYAPALTNVALSSLTVSPAAALGFDLDTTLVVTNAISIASNAAFMSRGRLTLNGSSVTNRGKVWLAGAANALTLSGDMVLAGPNSETSVNVPVLDVVGGLRITHAGLRASAGAVVTVGNDTGGVIRVGGDVVLEQAGWIYPYAHATNGGALLLACTNLTVDATSGIDAAGKGYAPSYGPGVSSYTASIQGGSGGAGYGGMGGTSSGAQAGGAAYGDVVRPRHAGSGAGGTTSANGGPGGGVIWISAANAVQLDGTLTANGKQGGAGAAFRYGGGGAGGSILLDCSTIAGSGTLQANGADGIADTNYPGGGGGGGRIAIHFATNAQALLPRPALRFSVTPGATAPPPYARQYWTRSDWGSVYLARLDSLLDLTSVVDRVSGYLLEPGLTQRTFSALSVQSGAALGFDTNMTVTVTGSISIQSNAALIARHATQLTCSGSLTNRGRVSLGGDTMVTVGGGLDLAGTNAEMALNRVMLTVGADVRVSGAANLRLFGAPTNGLPGDIGSEVAVTGDVWIETAGQLHPYSDPTNGGSVRIACRNLYVDAASRINADYKGFGSQNGPGKSAFSGSSSMGSGGAGYGGKGGASSSGLPGGTNYGSRAFPWDPGSGAGNSDQSVGGAGGGVIWIDADSQIQLDGPMTADGENGRIGSAHMSGGGSGGSVLLFCKQLTGGGDLGAIGGNGYFTFITNNVVVTNESVVITNSVVVTNASGGGAGGRIAVWYGVDRTVRQHLLDNLDNPVVQRRIHETQTMIGFTGTVSGVTGGSGFQNGEEGSRAFFNLLSPGAIFSVR